MKYDTLELMAAGAIALAAVVVAAPLALGQSVTPTPTEEVRPSDGRGHHGWGAKPAPRAMCEERVAHQSGRVAYLETRLNLTAVQRPLWEQLQAAARPYREQQRQLCALLPATRDKLPTTPERARFMEQETALRAAQLGATNPMLDALYAALTPVQREILDRPPHHGGRGGMGGHGMGGPRPL